MNAVVMLPELRIDASESRWILFGITVPVPLYVARRLEKLTVIDNLTPHMFRHTYATILYNAGTDVKSVQRFLGHADTQDIYPSAQKEQDATASRNRYLSENQAGKNSDAVKM